MLKGILGTAPKAKHQPPRHFRRCRQSIRPSAGDGHDLNAIRFIMLTACRLREVLDAKFDEIDFTAQTFSVPPARSKTGEPHLVPLHRRRSRSSRPRQSGVNPIMCSRGDLAAHSPAVRSPPHSSAPV